MVRKETRGNEERMVSKDLRVLVEVKEKPATGGLKGKEASRVTEDSRELQVRHT